LGENILETIENPDSTITAIHRNREGKNSLSGQLLLLKIFCLEFNTATTTNAQENQEEDLIGMSKIN
jgi:hypothetical protein